MLLIRSQSASLRSRKIEALQKNFHESADHGTTDQRLITGVADHHWQSVSFAQKIESTLNFLNQTSRSRQRLINGWSPEWLIHSSPAPNSFFICWRGKEAGREKPFKLLLLLLGRWE
jgi:hypothetical protein